MALAANALTSVANLEEILGDINDTLAENLINRASDIIEHYCGRAFTSSGSAITYTNEEYDGTGTPVLNLKQYPVTTFTRLQARDTDLDQDSWTTINTQAYQVYTDEGIIERVDASNFRERPYVYRVTYTAGYTTATLPDDLEQACIDVCVWLYNKRRGQNARSESIGDYSITYREERESLHDLGIDIILDTYKKPII